MLDRSRFTRLLSPAPGQCRSRTRPLGSRGARRPFTLEILEDRQAPATLTVNSTADTANPLDPYLSLREAVAIVNSPSLPNGLSDQILAQINGDLHAGGADTILFDPGTVRTPIVLGGTVLQLTLPSDTATVTIDGGTEGVTVDGNNATRVFRVEAGAQVAFDHLTVTRGRYFGYGAGILNNGGTVTVSDCTINSSSAYYGAGIANLNGTLVVTDSTLSSNSVLSEGGGIYEDQGTLTVSGSTLTSNSAPDGGGISVLHGTALVSDSTLRANSANRAGGGIILWEGTLTVGHCTFSGNLGTDSFSEGAGIHNNEGTLTVSDSAFVANTAGAGGGITNAATAKVTRCTFVSNTATNSNRSGGAIGTGDTLTVSDSTFTSNSAAVGGGIAGGGQTLTVTNCTLQSNTANQGGGIYHFGGPLTVTGSTLASNTALNAGGGLSPGAGGGLYNSFGTATVSNCTISANSARQGGGLYNTSSGEVISSTVTDNTASDLGGGVYTASGSFRLVDTIVAANRVGVINQSPDIFGAVTADSNHNLVGSADSNLSGIGNGTAGNLVGTLAAPIDPRLGPLGDNGGPTFTHAVLPDSLARGAGDVGSAADTDQRGLPRVVGGEIDLGSFQTQTAVAEPQVVSSDPGGILDQPVDHVRLTFNHPMDPASFSADGFSLTGPDGAIPLTGVTAVPSTNDQQFDVTFASQDQPGEYALTVDPAVRDVHGNPLASPFVGRLILPGLTGCILTVNSTADTANPTDPYLTLRLAIALVNLPSLPDGLSPEIRAQLSGPLHANGSDTIVFDPAVVTRPITLSGTQLELSQSGRTTRVTIDGGEAGVTVDGNDASRVFQVDAGVWATFDHLTILHGRVNGQPGGGIWNAGGTLLVSDTTIQANSAGDGAGIANTRGTLTVSDSALVSNSGSGSAGGLYNDLGTLTVIGSTLESNTASGSSGAGGGLYSARGTVTVSDSTITSNSAPVANAGGILAALSTVTLSRCIVSFNDGIGIESYQGTLTVSDSSISSNSEGGLDSGGTLTMTGSTLSSNSIGHAPFGVGIRNVGTAVLSNCTIAFNTGTQGGGIINSGTLTVVSSTIAGNSSMDRGGGIFTQSPGTLALENVIVAGNHDHAGAGGPDIYGAVDSASGYNLIGIGDGLSGISDGVNGNQIGTRASPLDPLLAALGDYGGPTQTMPLLPGSPALDAGDSGQAGTPDQRGAIRRGGVNIGAFQASAASFILSAPDTATAGVPFDIGVTVVDIFGQLAAGYTGTIHFSTSDPDPGVVLPPDYTFQPSDGGTAVFPAGVTLFTSGDQTLTVTDLESGFSGTTIITL
jgi:hypothetical protein